MPKAKKKTKTPKAVTLTRNGTEKLYRIRWELAAPFLMRHHQWQLVDVETKGKTMTAVLQAKS